MDANDQHVAGASLDHLESESMQPAAMTKSGGTAQPGPDAPSAGPFARQKAWRPIPASWLSEPPPPRRYLLKTVSEGVGVVPMGRVGFLVAEGAAGKSWALVQLALAVASGFDYLGAFEVAEPGAVLVAMGEEDQDEFRRRVFYAARCLEAQYGERDREAIHEAASRIVPMPLAGESAALCARSKVSPGEVEETEAYRDLRRGLQDQCPSGSDGWKLVILDPLSRFAGPDTEGDNYAATQFVELLERLATAPGGPTVAVAHHTNKASRGGETNGASGRGVTGLYDGARWQLNLDNVETPDGWRGPRLAKMHIQKNNYGAWPEPVSLARDPNFLGALRSLTAQERGELQRGQGAGTTKERRKPTPSAWVGEC